MNAQPSVNPEVRPGTDCNGKRAQRYHTATHGGGTVHSKCLRCSEMGDGMGLWAFRF